MKQQMNCPLCKEDVYSGIGLGCKMCGMITKDDLKFCSKGCEIQYNEINLKGGKK